MILCSFNLGVAPIYAHQEDTISSWLLLLMSYCESAKRARTDIWINFDALRLGSIPATRANSPPRHLTAETPNSRKKRCAADCWGTHSNMPASSVIHPFSKIPFKHRFSRINHHKYHLHYTLKANILVGCTDYWRTFYGLFVRIYFRANLNTNSVFLVLWIKFDHVISSNFILELEARARASSITRIRMQIFLKTSISE